ncbi:oligopeptidase F. Metallo peptidase. MEROPS family M03B [Granulicatella balaenopterae]|uniref:Oligopeptidase F n=1 Tax=Granulicatella balaenopterae TaxID=137733 RepID=A0A1H9MMV2_9LACT|nr:oligoendopeptidase F [Granulicatella balaenopterae]SER24881.1 oligopeptidase F. Metallo peptidase. MEROPS family M03B [Granulicatella balaenopterae]
MSTDKKLLTRDEVPEQLTWDLTMIYPSEEGFEKDLAFVKESVGEIESWKEKAFQSATNLLTFLEKQEEVEKAISTAYVYSHLKSDQDTSNNDNQILNQRAVTVYTEISTALSWFEPALLTVSDATLEEFYQAEPKLEMYRTHLSTLRIRKDHVLPAEQESLLVQASEALGGYRKTFSLLNNADLTFGKVKNEEGKEVELTHGNYSTFLESSDVEVRRGAFKAMYKKYIELKNTFANTLGNNIKVANFNAKAHKYSSARDAAMSVNQVPEEVYDTLVDVVNEKLPLLHRYIALQKKALNLDEMHMYDMYVPITGNAPISFTYDEAVKETYKALAPLGEDYAKILKEGFEGRWIDVCENEGKRSGAYSSGTYTTKPYILLNWHDDLSNFFTLVHEFGHSAHSYLTRKNQPYVYGSYSIFLAEIASTTNENLLTEYLLETYTDKESQKYILNSYLNRVKSTIFRQTQFAEFEHMMHQADQNGTPLTQAFLAEQYGELNARYYGEEVIQDEEIAYEWARIPHFYMGYYVYQYATGMAAASALAKRILNEGPEALEDYLGYLSAGLSEAPIEVMKKAGVDMTKPDYLYDALETFEERLEKLEALMAE